MERDKSSLQGVGVPSLQGVGVPSGVVDQGVSQGAAAGTALPPLRKRKLNASGSRKTSTVWEEFNILPDEPEPIAACKHCHKRYRCDPKTHGTSNMLAHSKVCYKNPALLLKDPNQTNLVSGEGGFLVPTSQRFNAAACRKAINTFVILDEHSFRVVEGVGFKQMCKQLQPQMASPFVNKTSLSFLESFFETKDGTVSVATAFAGHQEDCCYFILLLL
ncbi:uncharacterized protein LOC127102468 [Lathyrus oleraceus]|uniref:uncharacterized protein LOC127102468 n=1 Tax=Pisum sativum TaxID=3888 RepID=UPI0021CE0B47|nr:uncharacterized protein LOC127102468 [Pisum sativum]